uniref:Uncharacterized protein n=1 Tax=Rhizophora mucronata TaxID=61149 RepID=A0A2P2M0T7_RHIMU
MHDIKSIAFPWDFQNIQHLTGHFPFHTLSIYTVAQHLAHLDHNHVSIMENFLIHKNDTKIC